MREVGLFALQDIFKLCISYVVHILDGTPDQVTETASLSALQITRARDELGLLIDAADAGQSVWYMAQNS